jgi:hypothetical protein
VRARIVTEAVSDSPWLSMTRNRTRTFPFFL